MTDMDHAADYTAAAEAPSPKFFDFGSANLTKITDEAQEMELLHFDTEEPLGVFLMIRGSNSATFKAAARKEANAQRRREFEIKRKGKEAGVRLVEDDNAAGVALTATLIVGWRTVRGGTSEPVIYQNGRPVPFSEEAVIAWLTEYDWVIKQISNFAGEVRNFTKS